MEKKVLISIDGSIYSNYSLVYSASLFREYKDVSFHILTCFNSSSTLPEPEDHKNSLLPESLDYQKKLSLANLRLKNALQKCNNLGFDPGRITSSVVPVGVNIGATIQFEAERLMVDAIVVGRRGIGRVGEMLMGSVSSTLFKKCHSVPLWIIDGEVESKKILVPLDYTVHSLFAIDHLAHIFANRTDLTFYLFHCHKIFGKSKEYDSGEFFEKGGKLWSDIEKNGKDFLLQGATQILSNAGIDKQHIKIVPKTTDLEESYSIVRKALTYKCGTIVMGRRGAGMAKGLFGGVSDRTLNKTQGMALWIVG